MSAVLAVGRFNLDSLVEKKRIPKPLMPTHKTSESERFKGPVKYAEYLFARSLITLLQRLPTGFAYRLGRGVGWLAWKLMAGRRGIVRKNLEIVNARMAARSADGGGMMTDSGLVINDIGGQINDSSSFIPNHSSLALPLEAQVKEVFQRAGSNLFSGFTFNRMPTSEIAKHIEVEGLEQLETALGEGKGVIVLLAHMGPWEALTQLPQLAEAHGITAPFGAMYRPLNNTYLDDWFKSQREAKKTRLFSRRDGFHKPVDFLRGGGMLGILSDQKMREGPRALYFGVEVPTTPIPGLFHRRSGAPLCALAVQTISPTRWRLSLRGVPVAPGTDLSSREALASICNQAVADSLAESPLDGFWLHKRF